jgi:putative transposase
MASTPYRWRKLSEEDRQSVLEDRLRRRRPTHSPHHIDSGSTHYHLTAACFEHLSIIGKTNERLTSFSHQWLDLLNSHSREINAWVILPNHYHATVNYIHHNPVRHGYVTKWTDWPWSSAHDFLETHGRLEAERLWKTYPLQDFGQGWDDPEL